MVIVAAYNGGFALVLSEREFNEQGFDPNREYEVLKAKDGLWVLVDKRPLKAAAAPSPAESEQAALEGKLAALIRSKSLSERVEGKFEKQLADKELAGFQRMLKEQKAVLFKLPGYSKGVYKLPDELEAPKKKEDAPATPPSAAAQASPASPVESLVVEKKPEEYTLAKDGFQIIRSEFEARTVSEGLREQIKNGLIKGLKTFDGDYLLVRVDALMRHRHKFLDYVKSKKMTSLDNAAKDLNMPKHLIRVIAEFFKEDGDLVEKRKGLYQIVTGYE